MATIKMNGQDVKVYRLEMWGMSHSIVLEKAEYLSNGNLAVLMHSEASSPDIGWEPWDDLTTNLVLPLAHNRAFVKDEFYPEWLAKNGIAKPTGESRQSGWNNYLLMEFSDEALNGMYHEE